MDRIYSLFNYIFAIVNIFTQIMGSDYWLFMLIPIVCLGIFIITVIIRLVVRQVHY